MLESAAVKKKSAAIVTAYYSTNKSLGHMGDTGERERLSQSERERGKERVRKRERERFLSSAIILRTHRRHGEARLSGEIKLSMKVLTVVP